MMEHDVSPNGQYGSLDPGETLSVFHENSSLSSYMDVNNPPSYPNNWRNPTDAYRDEFGNEVKIPVTYDPQTSTFSPALIGMIGINNVLNGSPALLLTMDPNSYQYTSGGEHVQGNDYLVPPQLLANVDDFVNYWEASFAQALVAYHPESCYRDYYDP
ncbi:MAG: hypothetical protein GWN14_28960, partial [candidate division Zixibacteria bacterium]|nr:hypothetical protein [Gammaproteobacteria bacterium]NIX59845.1 hypothetical protein [candidate division Zixibacteria bacterium]